jgi:transposase
MQQYGGNRNSVASMRPHGSPGSLEARRRKMVAFLKRNLSLREIARRLGCHASSVLRWHRAFRSQGPAGLNPKPARGRPPRLSAPRKQRLVGLL